MRRGDRAATICRPEFIIADEPTALDVVVQKGVLA
jgi:ABC-type dipeptide/oligopeptide/nickel transport system ATPase component